MSTLAEKLGFSREAVRVAAYKHEEGHDLQTFGVVDVVEKGITKQVQVADTEVVVALRETDTDVFKLLEAEGARHLVDFFVRDADPETAYLISEIEDASGIRWKTLDRHLPTLVDAHVVRTVERDGKTHYAADRVSATTERIIELNEVLYDAFADRR
jgi:DNA-binding transcriptional ArsR family regulator